MKSLVFGLLLLSVGGTGGFGGSGSIGGGTTSGGPTYVSTLPYVSSPAGNATVTSASYTCAAGDSLIIFVSKLLPGSSLSITSTSTNTVTPEIPGQYNGGYNGVAMQQITSCNGSTGTYTATDGANISNNIGITAFEYSGLTTGLDGTNWNWCVITSSVSSTPSCAVTPSAPGGVIGAYVLSTGNGVAQASVSGWNTRENVASSSYYDATGVSGANTFPSITQGTTDYAQVMVVSLK